MSYQLTFGTGAYWARPLYVRVWNPLILVLSAGQPSNLNDVERERSRERDVKNGLKRGVKSLSMIYQHHFYTKTVQLPLFSISTVSPSDRSHESVG